MYYQKCASAKANHVYKDILFLVKHNPQIQVKTKLMQEILL